MNQIFESFLLNRTASGITEFFLLLIFVCLVGAVVMAWRGTAPRFTAYAPTLLTSLGILGTFTGIVIGLLNFDPAQLDASIGKLLDGLKTAFITSITGMGAGILFKVLSTTLLKPTEAEPESEVGPADILSKLDEQTRLLKATRDAIAGSEESSLSGQMKLLRTDLTDRHRDDRQAFDAFANDLREQLKEVAQMLSQAATEQIVDALTDILSKLDEQTRLLEATRDAVAGSEESSLSGQMKLLRTDLTDRHRDDRQAFDAFADHLREQLKEVAQMLSQAATEQVVNALTDILSKLDEQTRLLEATRDAVAGSEESSLSGQMKLLRTDLTDRHRDDRQAFDAFADHLREQLKEVAQMLSQAATEQIVDALRQVIADFNQKITEQFGDNFKRLDASVQKLVEWQEHYRQQLEQLHALYDQSVQNITNIDSAVAHIAESSSSIPSSMEKLSGIVETASHQLSELEQHLAAFSQLRDRAVEAVPQMQAHVEEITREISASVDAASEHYKELLASSDGYIQAQDEKAQGLLRTFADAGERVQRDLQTEHQQLLASSDTYIKAQDEKAQEMLAVFMDASERVQRNTQSVQQQVADSIQQMQSQVEASMNEVLGAQNQAVSQGVERLHEHMRQSASRTGEAVNAQLEALDQLMNQEIERVMNEMGRALAQIAGKFTADYSELTEAMHGIVERGGRGR